MGRYTSNDNKSMQCNPNNERYWSSRGYDDNDSSEYTTSYFGLNSRLSKEQKELGYKYWKELVDSISIELFGKKTIFMEKRHDSPNCSRHPTGGDDVSFLFKNVLKENVIYKDLTVSFKSFEDFIRNNLNFDLLKLQYEELEKNISSLKDNIRYKYYRDKSIKSEISWLNKIKRHHSFKFLQQVLEEEKFIKDDIKRNYIYFNKVYTSDSYMVFQLDPRRQGYTLFSLADMSYSWVFHHDSHREHSSKPDIVYENFEDTLSV